MRQRPFDEYCKRAFDHISASILMDRELPDQVFKGEWKYFRFCIFDDWILNKRFIPTLHKLLRIEGADVACMWNAKQDASPQVAGASLVYLDSDTTPEEYDKLLDGDVPAKGWFYDFNRFVCMSDVGEWCIFGHRLEAIGIFGFRDEHTLQKFSPTLEMIRAVPLTTQMEWGGDPFGRLIPKWSEGLLRNYASQDKK